MGRIRLLTLTFLFLVVCTSFASAELLALLNYESKPNQPVRREGIAIMEIDPDVVPWYYDLVTVPPTIPPPLGNSPELSRRSPSVEKKVSGTVLGWPSMSVCRVSAAPTPPRPFGRKGTPSMSAPMPTFSIPATSRMCSI